MTRVLLIFAFAAAFATPLFSADSPRDRLGMLIGDWTIEGREDSFREVCDWFHANAHVVCNSESRGPKGLRKGVSVFSYDDATGRYAYYHYGSSGVAVAQRVFFQGPVMVSTVELEKGTDVVREHVWVTPLADGSLEFREEASKNGGPWEQTVRFRYVRRAAMKGTAR
jgi:hypothetical protein